MDLSLSISTATQFTPLPGGNGNAVFVLEKRQRRKRAGKGQERGRKRQRSFLAQEKGRKGAGNGNAVFHNVSGEKKETATLFFNTSQMSSVSCLHPHLLHPHEQVAEWACGGGRREQRFCIMSEAAICSRTASRSHGRGGTSPTRFRPYRGRGARIERIFSHIFEYFRIFSNIFAYFRIDTHIYHKLAEFARRFTRSLALKAADVLVRPARRTTACFGFRI